MIPRFSVVIPTYNRVAPLSVVLGDIMSQSWNTFEVIVVNDGSVDATTSQLRRSQDPRIRVVESEHVGRCRARNLGADASTGEWLIFLDDDDRVASDWLESYASACADPSVGLVCCAAQF